MTKKTTLNPGDRIAFSRAFLKSIGGDYATVQRRGVFIAPDTHSNLARVRWDDYDYSIGSAQFKAAAEQYGEDYAEEIAANGSRVNIHNICRVGSVAFAD